MSPSLRGWSVGLAFALATLTTALLSFTPVGFATERPWEFLGLPVDVALPMLALLVSAAVVGAWSGSDGALYSFGGELAATALLIAYPYSAVDWIGLAIRARLTDGNGLPGIGVGMGLAAVALGYAGLLYLRAIGRDAAELDAMGVDPAEVAPLVPQQTRAWAAGSLMAFGLTALLAMAGFAASAFAGVLPRSVGVISGLGLIAASVVAVVVYWTAGGAGDGADGRDSGGVVPARSAR